MKGCLCIYLFFVLLVICFLVVMCFCSLRSVLFMVLSVRICIISCLKIV